MPNPGMRTTEKVKFVLKMPSACMTNFMVVIEAVVTVSLDVPKI